MAYTNSFVCPQCCKTSCETLPSLFGAAGACPGAVPNVDKEICLSVQVFHNMSTGGAWVPPSPFGGTFKADCRTSFANNVNVIDSTSGAHPQAPRYLYLIDSSSVLGFAFYPTVSVQPTLKVQPTIRVPHFSAGTSSTYEFQHILNILTGQEAKSFTCSPFKIVTEEGNVYDSRDYGATVLGKFHVEITMGLCPTVPIPSPTPLVSHVTTPCKYLGPQIQDPAKCQCGTANLMSCALYGTCRRTGTPLAGEPICLTCPSYQSP